MRIYRSKFEEVAYRLAPEAKSILDVGCRDGKLKRFLPPDIDYTGVDLMPGPAVARQVNLEKGIPYPDNAFDAAVALDVLEHTDNIWFSFDELVRVARRQVMIVLPNSYHWKARLRFIRGKEGDKYLLSPKPVEDRHRWLPSYTTSLAFCEAMSRKHGLRLHVSIGVDEGSNLLRETLGRVLPPNFMSIAAFFTFEKN
jgi:SAM-dependent methyltransferase